MNPKKYRPFPHYIPAPDQPIHFVRYVAGANGIPGRLNSVTGTFDSDDGMLNCDPSEIVEWHPAAGYVYPPNLTRVVATINAINKQIAFQTYNASNPIVTLVQLDPSGYGVLQIDSIEAMTGTFTSPVIGNKYLLNLQSDEGNFWSDFLFLS